VSSLRKSLTLVLIVLCIIPLATYQQIPILAQSSSSTPAIQWQQQYGDYHTELVSNLIQTNDGGFAFLDLGYSHSMGFGPSTLYKTDSLGNIEWQKSLSYFTAITLIQTSDEGFEISGNWNYYPTGGKTPALLKTDSTGNIQWAKNYTDKPPNLNIQSSRVLLNDNSSIYLQAGGITKSDSNGNIQWQINATFTYFNYKTPPVRLSSLIETSDGSIAALGVGTPYSHDIRQGIIVLVKTEEFLPKPYSMELPTPLPTPVTLSNLPLTFWGLIFVAVILSLVVALTLTIFRRYRETAKLKQ
jgi:hypothetical protein